MAFFIGSTIDAGEGSLSRQVRMLITLAGSNASITTVASSFRFLRVVPASCMLFKLLFPF